MKTLLVLLSLVTTVSAFAGETIYLEDYQEQALQAEMATIVKRSDLNCTQTRGSSYGLSKQELNSMIKEYALDLLKVETIFDAASPDDGKGYMSFTGYKRRIEDGILIEDFNTFYAPFINKAKSYNSFYFTYSTDKRNAKTLANISSTIDFQAQCYFLN